MNTNEKTSDVVNELLVINNDRYQGYHKAAEETKDVSLRSLFMKLGEQSLQFKRELQSYVTGEDHLDAAYDTDKTKASGKLYRVWMDIKAALSGNDRKAILSSCEYGEDVALKNYDEALDRTDELQSDVLMTIQKQRSEIKQSHDMIKALRDNSGDDNNRSSNNDRNYNEGNYTTGTGSSFASNTGGMGTSGMSGGNVTGTGVTGTGLSGDTGTSRTGINRDLNDLDDDNDTSLRGRDI
jgi:uncharacterized protein (TIGR02284 family)